LHLPSVESPEEPDLGLSAAVSYPFYPETGTGNRNPNDVTPNVGRGQSASTDFSILLVSFSLSNLFSKFYYSSVLSRNL